MLYSLKLNNNKNKNTEVIFLLAHQQQQYKTEVIFLLVQQQQQQCWGIFLLAQLQ